MITLVTPHETKLMDKLRMCSEALRDSTEQCRVYRAEINALRAEIDRLKIERDAQRKVLVQALKELTTIFELDPSTPIITAIQEQLK